MTILTVVAALALAQDAPPPPIRVRRATPADLDMIPRPLALPKGPVRQEYIPLTGWRMEEQSTQCRYHVAFGAFDEAITFQRTLRGSEVMLVGSDVLGLPAQPPEYGTPEYDAARRTATFGSGTGAMTGYHSRRETLRDGAAWASYWSIGTEEFTGLSADPVVYFTIGGSREVAIPVGGFSNAMINLGRCIDNIRLARLDLRPNGDAFAYGPYGPQLENNPSDWIEYPSSALRREQGGVVGFSVIVDRFGLPQDCMVTASSGVDALDRATCSQFRRHAYFYPARNADGIAVAGTYANTIRWTLPD